ncbi:SGNH/GDSL hydrolase family protein [Streptomyces sp. NPDC001985]|uniref:SGNH/GDSL hydrolase family protein n=1 Tax=Streptomyces sp. NPDC001985 TaxID=3154406 RepID=UPI00331AD64C
MTTSRRLLSTAVAAVTLTLLTPSGTLSAGPGTRDGQGAGSGTGRASAAAHHRGWAGTWQASPSHAVPALPGTSIRNVVHTSVGGGAARVRVTNRFGTAPLPIGAVTIALQRPGLPKSPEAAPGTMRRAYFDGARAVTVPTGRDLVTDPVPMTVPAGANLLITVYTPTAAGPATQHRSAVQTNFLAPGAGDRTADEGGAAYTTTTGSWHYVTGVDVLSPRTPGSVVALGDSITDGSGSTNSANRRWPDRLAARLGELPPHRRPGVLNAGIAGNRLLLDGTGPSMLARFDADVLSRTGVRTVIVLAGVNDIKNTPVQSDPAVFDAAHRQLVRRAHARGIQVIGATIAPFGGNPAWTEDREAVRRQINHTIRTGGVFDAVADFDAAVRDPAHPTRIHPAYDPGDHLHFNDAGMRALADAVDLDRLRVRAESH